MLKPTQLKLIYLIAATILAALLYVRGVSVEFALGTDTFSHPYKSFTAALVISGMAWLCLISMLKNIEGPLGKHLWLLILMGVIFRVMFLGSTPIYEDDWNRYLWDGSVTVNGFNPYEHPPEVTFVVGQDAPQEVKDLQALSGANGGITARINNPHLTTIYPPVAMGVFSLATLLKPFDLDGLRWVYLGLEMGGLWLLFKTLGAYGRRPDWALVYWLNPMLIYSVYNAGHMDIILVPLLIGALYLVKKRPLWASLILGLAAAVKIWPLILGPVLLRGYRRSVPIFIGGGIIMGVTAAVLLSPMLLSLGESSGLQAYSGGWQRSSFIFGYLEAVLGFTRANPGLIARLCVALFMTGLALWLTFKRGLERQVLPTYLMIVPLCLYLLSPTGYPWYVLWFLPFLPFFPLYGAALLTVTVSLYYLRFAMGERDIYDLYTSLLVPLQFGLPLLVLLWEMYVLRKRSNA